MVHVHFGMSGKWSIFDKSAAPEPTPTTRLRLEDEDYVAHLSAMIVKLGSTELFLERQRALGQDPLREDADADLLWEKVSASRKQIGQVLMDQSYFAGVGNIYRAEILFKAGVHPSRVAAELKRHDYDRIWAHSVALLQRGFESGSILTVDPEEARRLKRPTLRRYIYNRKTCGRCDTAVISWDMNSRTCYACPSCQPLQGVQAVPGSGPVDVFKSHCAKDSLEERMKTPEKLSVAELRKELKKLGYEVKGRKPLLLERYKLAVKDTETTRSLDDLKHLKVTELRVQLRQAGLSTKGTKEVLMQRLLTGSDHAEARKVKPGRKHITKIATAEAAAEEKRLAGEKRNVEHVAEDERSARLRRRRNRMK